MATDDDATVDPEGGDAAQQDLDGTPAADREPDDREGPGDDPLEPGDGQVRYELHEWSTEARRMVDSLLKANDILHAWEGTTLVVDQSHEAVVDALIDEVDMWEQTGLDPDAERTVYEVNEWTMDQLGVLTAALGDAAIPYEFDVEGDLAVLSTDEERVEAILDTLEFGTVDEATAAGEGDDDGLETAEIVSDLFVACDRLHNNPRDADGILGAVAAAERLDGRSMPFGYEPRVWNGICARSLRLKSMLEDDAVSDDLIVDEASEFRLLLRQYV